MEGHKVKKVFKKIFKVLGWFVLSVILLLIVIALAIQLPVVQNKLVQKGVAFLEEKIGTEVSLDRISISFPKTIVLEGLYLEDQKKDTLLYAGKFALDTDLWALTRREIQLNELTLERCRAYIHRPEKDSAYNFSYILKAFADTTAVADTTVGKPWKFSIEDIAFEDVRSKYHDYLTGNIIDLSVGDFEVSISEFDLDKMKIIVDEINLKNTRASVVQTKQPEVTEEVAEENNPITYDIGVADILLENIDARFHQQALGQEIRLNLGKSELETDKIDLKLQRIDLERFMMENTFISYHQRPVSAQPSEATHDPEPVAEKQAEQSKPWTITLDEFTLAGNSLQFYDFTKPQIHGAVDFNHLWITNLAADAQDILFAGTEIKCDLNQFSFREKSGFAINNFEGIVDLQKNSLDINDLLLTTPNSRIEFSANATFPSLEQITKQPDKTKFEANIDETAIGLRDIYFFSPTLKDSLPLNIPSNSKIRVDAKAEGTVASLRLDELSIRAFGNTYLNTSGTVKGLPDINNLVMDINVKPFHTTDNDIARIIPASMLPDSLNIPDEITLNARYTGSLSKANFNTTLATSDGSVTAKGKMNIDSASASRGFNADVAVNKINLGKILMKPKEFGELNLTASIDATGLTPEEMDGKFKAYLKDFIYQGYKYDEFKLDGEINKGVYTGVASMEDENLDFRLDGKLDFSESVPLYNLTFDLRNANFKALNLSQRPLKARGTFATTMRTADFKVLNGDFGLRKVAIYNGDALYTVDSLLFASLDQEGKSKLTIDSDLMSGKFEGTFNVFSMPDVLKEYFATYYSLHDTSMVAKKDGGPQNFKFKIELRKTELLTDILLPELTEFKPGTITGEFNSEKKLLDMKIELDEVQYSNIGVSSFVFSTNSNPRRLNYNIMIDEIRMDSTRIDGFEFNGTVANDSIHTNMIIYDSLDKTKYLLGAVFNSLENQYQIRLLSDQVKLNYVDWKVSPDNYLRFGGKKLVANNIKLQNGREQIIIDSKDDAASSILIGFRELNLEYLVSMVAIEKPVSGLLHGDILLKPDTADMTFTADLGIKDFSITEIPWGDISLAVSRKTADEYNVKFGIESKQNLLRAKGTYLAGDNPSVNLTANIDRFDVATVEPLTGGQLKNMKGQMTGKININGPTSKPDINGAINFKALEFFSTYVNTAFSLKNETISLTDRGIEFNSFELLDSRKNAAVLDGLIATSDYKNFNLQLNLEMSNFRLLNTTEKDNDLFYGLVDVDATVKINGDMNQPVIDARLGLSDESRITYIVPQSEASVMEGAGIVRFVDRTFEGDPFMKTINPADTVKSEFTGLNLTAQIELTDSEQFTVIIDPTTGDQLTVRGNTTLTLSMDPTGDINLTGRYEITEGTYNLSFYKFLKREFQIERGSTMTWSGDPMNAQMDIAAIFEVETAPIDLLSAQLQGSDPNEQNKYKQKLPFLVYLNIDGQLLKPEISFKLDMPEDERDYMGGNVYSRIQDINTREADLNKQVFALLILKRFISDNPFENQGSTGLAGTARSSVSKILTDQLNRLSENVRGVELSFDVKSYEDFSSGQAQGNTELQLGLEKNLFNDRLVVKVAGNIDVEGENTNRNATDFIGDLALEYKLTEDGRFRITGFRNGNYDMIDGELTETGAGLIYIKDYNVLSELFKANAKDKR